MDVMKKTSPRPAAGGSDGCRYAPRRPRHPLRRSRCCSEFANRLDRMAIGSTMHTFEVQLADMDRGVYDDYSLRVARHPSETDAYMLTRVLAYGLEYTEGITFGGSVSSTEEPAVLVRDLTGLITAWIEVGGPDAERMHQATRAAERAVVYTHRDPAKVIAQWADKRIHRSE